jgi:hypothetical protein
MQHNERNVPDWLLERLALGELDAESAADVRRRLAAEGRSPDDVAAAVATSNREILAELPASQVATEVRRRAERAAAAERPTPRRAFLWGAPLALAGGVALVAVMARPADQTDVSANRPVEAPERVIVKGPDEPLQAARLLVYRHRTNGDQRLFEGARAARGDLLQLAYGSRAGGYGVLLSIDGAGKVTLHWPEKGGGAAPALKASGEIRLPSAYELDDAPAFERFFLVRAATPFSVATAEEAARALAAQPTARKQALALPPGFEQISVALDKPHAAKKELP